MQVKRSRKVSVEKSAHRTTTKSDSRRFDRTGLICEIFADWLNLVRYTRVKGLTYSSHCSSWTELWRFTFPASMLFKYSVSPFVSKIRVPIIDKLLSQTRNSHSSSPEINCRASSNERSANMSCCINCLQNTPVLYDVSVFNVRIVCINLNSFVVATTKIQSSRLQKWCHIGNGYGLQLAGWRTDI